MKSCSFPGCKEPLSLHQCETTEKLFGKPFCINHEDAANAEAQAAVDAMEPPEFKILKECGWNIDRGCGVKVIEQSEVTIDLKRLAEKGRAVKVAGFEYGYGDKASVDAEVKKLFDALAMKNGALPAKRETPAPKPAPKNLPAVQSPPETVLSIDTIQKYINPMATEQEAMMFLQLCHHRKLNPFLKEAYLIKYSEKEPAAFVVGKDAFIKRADQQPDYRGFQAGIILLNGEKKLERREGSMLLEGEKLLGGWAKVFRTNREPFLEEVALSEYIKVKEGKPVRSWATMPCTMIRKVAIVHALREAFPHELSGMYDAAEMGGDV